MDLNFLKNYDEMMLVVQPAKRNQNSFVIIKISALVIFLKSKSLKPLEKVLRL